MSDCHVGALSSILDRYHDTTTLSRKGETDDTRVRRVGGAFPPEASAVGMTKVLLRPFGPFQNGYILVEMRGTWQLVFHYQICARQIVKNCFKSLCSVRGKCHESYHIKIRDGVV